MTRLLLRASKSPFESFCNGPIPRRALPAVYGALADEGTKNIGNLVFAHSVYKVLSALGTTIDIDRYRLSLDDRYASEAEAINERYDAFVLPMCNAFRPEYRTTLARITRTLRTLRIPCIVTGVGAQLEIGGDGSELGHMADEVRAFTAAVLDRSASIGVRGETTRDYLVGLGFPADRIDVIGCPSMFYHGAGLRIDKGDLGTVALNLSDVDDRRLDDFTRWFDCHRDGVTYVPQVRRLMPGAARGSFAPPQKLDAQDRLVPRLLDENRIAFLCDLMPWMDFLHDQSFAIGTRIHGNIVALLAGTPAHVIAHDSRTLELARYFDIPHTPVSEVAGFDLRHTFERSDYDALHRGHPARLATYAAFLARNGLRHILYEPEQLALHDARVRDSLRTERWPSPPPAWRTAMRQGAGAGRRLIQKVSGAASSARM